MRILLATILAFSILLFQFSELAIFVSFKINQEFIAKNICIEKDVESSTCNGCCQLKKRVANNLEQKKEAPLLQIKYEINFTSPLSVFLFYVLEGITVISFVLETIYSQFFYTSFFHPPE